MKILKIIPRVIVILLTLELCARIEDMARYDADIWKPYTKGTTIEQEDKFGLTGKPNGRYKKWRLNNNGFRGPNIKAEKAGGVIRILCAGASETFGLYEDEGSTWPEQLIKCFIEDDITNVEYINASFYSLGYSYHNIIKRFKESLIKYDPDIVVIYSSLITYMYDYGNRAGINARTPNRYKIPLVDNIRIIGKIKDAYRKFIPQYMLDLKDGIKFRKQIESNKKLSNKKLLSLETAKKRIEKDILELNDICRNKGIILILSSHVQRTDSIALLQERVYNPHFSDKEIVSIHYELNTYLKQLAAREHIIFVDNMILCEAVPRNLADSMHFTNEGASVIANNFYAAIAAKMKERMVVAQK